MSGYIFWPINFPLLSTIENYFLPFSFFKIFGFEFNDLLKSKNIVLNEFNLFKRMINIIEESAIEDLSLTKTQNKIYSVGYFWKKDVGIKEKTKHHIKRKLRLNVRNY